ncbi:MAG: zinc-binding dehydrogenase [Telluria sp.]
MQAIIIKRPGAPEELELGSCPDPRPTDEQVLVEVKAFGLNQAELHFRSGAWAPAAPVTGIECAGVVRSDPSGALAPGQPVLALLGGLGRQLNGTYAELVAVPRSNLVSIVARLSWEELAALPVSYGCAWTILHRVLELRGGECVLVRGATSALGRALVRLAGRLGAHVVATTRNPDGLARLRALGAAEAIVDDGRLASGREDTLDHAVDLVGTSSIIDTLATLRRGGRACIAGFLGGAAPLQTQPVFDLPSGRFLTSFASALALGGRDFPVSEIPFQSLIDDIASGHLASDLARVLPPDAVAEGHQLLERGGVHGKVVVRW